MCHRQLVSSAVRRDAKLRADFEPYASQPSGPSGSLIDRCRRDRSAAEFGLDLAAYTDQDGIRHSQRKNGFPREGRYSMSALSTRSCEQSALPHAIRLD